ncbi:MarR family winged helix-turn-helix transcriptional regulator [Methanolobus sp. ZRKC2]|uniref:MarR family winged helix-turn-helix transcriptional regulator n=1 Tax=Methanolobus sp. ZRKC2 TaxID=3125783 RepID=UPI0032534F90
MVNNFQYASGKSPGQNSNMADPEVVAGEIVDTLVRVINKASSIEKDPVDIGHGILLHPSEIHLIDMAGRFPDESVSQLASRLGITKGAVSQTAKKLEEKGYLERANKENDKKTIVLKLTGYGEDAFRWHHMYHEAMNRKMAADIEGMDHNDIENLKHVLMQFEEMLEKCPEVRKEITRTFQETISED